MEKKENALSLIIENYQQNSNVQCLNFSHHCLRILPQAIASFVNVKVLLFHCSNLIVPPIEISKFCQTLKELILSNNQLTVFPSELGNLKNLQVLDLSNNSLGALPAEIGNLSSLQRLWINGCNLILLPSQIGNLKALSYLGVKDNKLHDFPNEFVKLHHLHWLNCAKNSLNDVSTFFLGNRISYVDLSDNCFKSIPNAVRGKPNLKTIVLCNNEIATMNDDCLLDLSEVVKLDLRQNPINVLPKHWKGMNHIFLGTTQTSSSM